jgi:hypothetical protein
MERLELLRQWLREGIVRLPEEISVNSNDDDITSRCIPPGTPRTTQCGEPGLHSVT